MDSATLNRRHEPPSVEVAGVPAVPRELEDIGPTNANAPNGQLPPIFLKPVCNAAEDDESFEVELEVPGAKNIDVKFAAGQITITAQKLPERYRPAPRQTYLCERKFGTFKFSVAVPFQPNPKLIEARMRDGILTVRVPRPL